MSKKDSNSEKVDHEVDKAEDVEEARFLLKYGILDCTKMIQRNEEMFTRLGVRPRYKVSHEASIPLGVANLLELQKSVARTSEIAQRLNNRLPKVLAQQQNLSEIMQKRTKRLSSLDFESFPKNLQTAIDRLTLANRVIFGASTSLDGIIKRTTKLPDFIARIEGASSILRQLSQLSQLKQLPQLLELTNNTAVLADALSATVQTSGFKAHDTSASHEVEATFEADGEGSTTSGLENEPTQGLLEWPKTITITDVIMMVLAFMALLPSETETKAILLSEDVLAEVHELNETVKGMVKYLSDTSKGATTGKASTKTKQMRVISSQGAPLRSAPATNAKKLEQVSIGIEVATLGTKDGWIQVAVETDRDVYPVVGWIHKKHLRPSDQ